MNICKGGNHRKRCTKPSLANSIFCGEHDTMFDISSEYQRKKKMDKKKKEYQKDNRKRRIFFEIFSNGFIRVSRAKGRDRESKDESEDEGEDEGEDDFFEEFKEFFAEKNQIDCYVYFGVDFFADKEVIKKKYRELALKLHPDKGGDTEKFVELQTMYEKIMKLPNKK
jgi:hypothetical protein